jgi:hypothetical protein
LGAFGIIRIPAMTKVQRSFRLQRPLDEALMQRIAEAYGTYGLERIRISPSRDVLMVEYDATRLQTPDVEAALERAGIPVAGEVTAG